MHPIGAGQDDRVSGRRWLLAVLLSGGALRLAVAPFGGYQGDIHDFGLWATRLATQPVADFYAAPFLIDHLPGDLWVLWLLAHVYHLVSPTMDVHQPIFAVLIKGVATLADEGISVLLYLIGRRYGGRRVGLCAAAFYAFNPAAIFLTGVWGQWDALSGLFVLLALWLLLRGTPEWSFPVLTYAALIKPPLGALAPLFVFAYFLHNVLPYLRSKRSGSTHDRSDRSVESGRRVARRVVIALTTSVALFLLVTLPFDVGVAPLVMRWNLVDRIAVAVNLYRSTTVFAFNLWGTPLAGNPRPDDRLFLLGLDYQRWGVLLLASAYLFIFVQYWRSPGERSLLWACLAMLFASFMFATRVHERYLFPTFMVVVLVAAITPRLRWFFIALSTTFLANLFVAYNNAYPVLDVPFPYTLDMVFPSLSVLNMGLLLYVLVRGHMAVTQAPAHDSRPTSGAHRARNDNDREDTWHSRSDTHGRRRRPARARTNSGHRCHGNRCR